MKVILGVTGSVAAILTPTLVDEITKAGHEVEIVATEKSLYFCEIEDLSVGVWRDKHEWQRQYYVRKSPVLHIELRERADILLIAPLSANTLAKLANGLSDNLLTCVVRAWNPEKPVVLAPAMNTQMWNHPATAEHLERLTRWIPKLTIVQPIKKMLACGTEGMGAMAEIETIMEAVMMVAPPEQV
jgi:phosphopantothenoylcysteine decarboxylase